LYPRPPARLLPRVTRKIFQAPLVRADYALPPISEFSMTRQIRFNAFDMNCFGRRSPPLWAHPLGRSWQYKDLEHWADAAQMLERGIFDGIFIADVMGYHDVYQGSPR
jgi:hypothetical protein